MTTFGPATYFQRQMSLIVDTLDVSGFHATFHIEKTLKQTPNAIDLRIFNLSKDHRQQLESKNRVTVQVKAGYGDTPNNLPTIFLGDIRNVFSLMDGPDWVTYITSGDGEIVNREARISQSFSSGTFFRDVINATIDKIGAQGITTGNAKAAVADATSNPGFSNQYQQGVSVSGPALDQLNSLLRSSGMEASIQDKELQILKKGNALKNPAILLSANSGLIGSPQRDLNKIVKARSLLNGDLKPGRMVSIQSIQFSGFYRVERATYIGDVAGNDWYTDVECKQVSATGEKA